MECFEFLNSGEWLNTKAMQLGCRPDEITTYAQSFLIDIRDRDHLEGRDLNDLRSHFISWFKIKKEKNGTAVIKKEDPMFKLVEIPMP